MTQTEQQNVPKLRFPGFDEEWKTSPISDWLSKVIDYRGKAPPKTETGIPLITARNVRMGHLDFAVDEYIDSILFETWMNRGRPNPGDVMFTTEAPLGNVAQFPAEGVYALGQRIITLQPDREHCDSGFLFQTLLGPRMQRKVDARGTGSTAKGIKSRLFVKIPMDAPTPPEQRKIAGFLGAVDERIAQVTRKKALLEDYKKGCMQQLFSQSIRFKDDQGNDFPDWEEKPLGDIAKVFDGTHQTPKYVDKGVPFYSVEHVTANSFSNTKFIAEDVFIKENKRVVLERGDILLTRIGNIGTARLIDWDVRASFYVSLALVKVDETTNSKYLAQAFSFDDFQRELWHRTIHVAFPKKINLGEISKCVVRLPHPDEQQKIADFLSAIDTKIDLVAKELEQTKTFKKGLLQQMFV